MSTSEIEAFVQVVRAGGFTAAGRRVSVPKSTLSKQVARLEAELGVRLLQRSTRRVRLTQEGEAFYARCAPAIDALVEASEEARASAEEPRGTLVIACPFDFARDWLSPLLPAFYAAHPTVSLEVRVSPRRVDLVAEGVDVAIRGGVLDDSDLVARKLADSEVVLCATPAYLARHGHPAGPDALGEHALLTFAAPPGGWPLQGPNGVVRLRETGLLRINEWGSLAQAVRQGLGIGLVEVHSVIGDLKEGTLTRVLPRWSVTGGGLYAVFPSRRQLAPKVRVFVDFLAERLPIHPRPPEPR